MASKKYIITTAKEIPCLSGICGPITEPVSLERNDVLALVKKGFEVYECNPYDPSERVRVTRANVNSITFSRGRATVTAQRLLNRSIQDMEKPVVVDTVKKNKVEKTETKNVSKNDDTRSNETANKQNKSDSAKPNETIKIATPDAFSK